MQEDEPGIPAWLICEDIFNKLKTELITQAMDTLQIAIDAKAIEITGNLVTLPDKPSETEMQLFIINKLIEQKESIIERYGHYLFEEENGPLDANKIEQKERLKKFLLAVEQIDALMQYSKVFDAWINDAAMQVTEKDPSEIVKITAHGDEARLGVLDYVLKNKKIEKEEVLTAREHEILVNAMK